MALNPSTDTDSGTAFRPPLPPQPPHSTTPPPPHLNPCAEQVIDEDGVEQRKKERLERIKKEKKKGLF